MPDHNAANRLRRDVADYLLSAGNVGKLVVFDAGELETFLGANYFSQGKPLRRIARFLKRPYKVADPPGGAHRSPFAQASDLMRDNVSTSLMRPLAGALRLTFGTPTSVSAPPQAPWPPSGIATRLIVLPLICWCRTERTGANAANVRRLPGSACPATSDLMVFYAAPSGYETSRRPARMPRSGVALSPRRFRGSGLRWRSNTSTRRPDAVGSYPAD